MSFHEFIRIYLLARRNLAAPLAMGLISLGCWRVEAQESKPDEVPHRPDTALGDNDSGLLWQEQMHDAWSALNQKDYGMAEQSCKEALKTAGKLGPTDGRVTTNLIFLAGIYQMENKPDLAEQTFKTAIASREKAGDTNAPDLVMPLEKLANFYYFAEHRYDLATPVCLRILQIVEKASPRDAAEIIKRARAVAAVYRIQAQYAKAEPFYQQTLALAATNEDELPDCLLTTAGFYQEWGKYDKAESLCRQALAMREKAAAANPGTDSQMNLAISLYGLAETYRSWGKLDQAEQFYRQSRSHRGEGRRAGQFRTRAAPDRSGRHPGGSGQNQPGGCPLPTGFRCDGKQSGTRGSRGGGCPSRLHRFARSDEPAGRSEHVAAGLSMACADVWFVARAEIKQSARSRKARRRSVEAGRRLWFRRHPLVPKPGANGRGLSSAGKNGSGRTDLPGRHCQLRKSRRSQKPGPDHAAAKPGELLLLHQSPI